MTNLYTLQSGTQSVHLGRNMILLPNPQDRIEETVSGQKLLGQRSPLCRKMRKTARKLNVSEDELE